MEDRNRLIDFARLSLFKSNNDKTYSSKLNEKASLALPRHTEAKGMGSMELSPLKGNTLVWNQLIPLRLETFYANGITLTYMGNGIYSMSGTPTTELAVYLGRNERFVQGHKYIIYGNHTNDNGVVIVDGYHGVSDRGNGVVYTANGNGMDYYIAFYGLSPVSNFVIAPRCIDLTQMFGAGNEPSTYEEFLSRKPLVGDEFAYNEGEIVSVANPIIKTTGRNLWDEEWRNGYYDSSNGQYVQFNAYLCNVNPIHVRPSTTYHLFVGTSGAYGRVEFYDANGAFIQELWVGVNHGFTTPSNCEYINFWHESYHTYNHDICINVSDPSFNGQYEPYISHTLPIDTEFEVEGEKFFPLGLNGINGVHDELTPTKAVKRFGVKVFDGTEDWALNPTRLSSGVNAYQCYYVIEPENDNILCAEYMTRAWGDFGNFSIYAIVGYGIIVETDGVQSLESFKAQLMAHPLVVVYELAEPIEVAVESGLSLPYQQGGLETFEGISAIPSGDVTYYHDVQYNHWSLAAKTFVGNLIADTIKAAGKLLKIESEVQVKALRIGKARISWDESAEAIKVDGSMYTTGFSSAGGVNPSGASGNVSVLAKMLTFTQSDFDEAWGMYHKTITNDLHNPLLITQCTRTDGEVVITDVRVTSESIDIMVDLEGEYKFIAMGTQS